MIKNIFFPEKIGNNFLSSYSFLAFQYTENFISISGFNDKSGLTIKQIQNKIWPEELSEQSQLINNSLNKKFDSIINLIPDHLVIYRKIILPISDKEIIRKIIFYEVGPTLPFNIEESCFDFFTIPDKNKKTCIVWIAFVIKKNLNTYLEPLELINIKNINIVVSLPGVVDWVNKLNKKNDYIVGYQNGKSVTLCFFENEILKDVISTHKDNLDNIITNLKTKDPELLWFSNQQIQSQHEFKKIKITEFKTINIDANSKAIHSLELLAAASQLNYAYNFNLIETNELNKINLYQLFTFSLLILLFFLSMGIHLLLNNLKFKDFENKSNQEVRLELKKVGLESKKTSLPLIIKDVKKIIEDQEKIWFSFSQQKRFSFLFYLAELTKQLDKKALGLSLKKLTITPDSILISGEVKDYPALQLMETELNESLYFKTLVPLQEISFNVNIKIKNKEISNEF